MSAAITKALALVIHGHGTPDGVRSINCPSWTLKTLSEKQDHKNLLHREHRGCTEKRLKLGHHSAGPRCRRSWDLIGPQVPQIDPKPPSTGRSMPVT